MSLAAQRPRHLPSALVRATPRADRGLRGLSEMECSHGDDSGSVGDGPAGSCGSCPRLPPTPSALALSLAELASLARAPEASAVLSAAGGESWDGSGSPGPRSWSSWGWRWGARAQVGCSALEPGEDHSEGELPAERNRGLGFYHRS
jgi:hypothetical protein